MKQDLRANDDRMILSHTYDSKYVKSTLSQIS